MIYLSIVMNTINVTMLNCAGFIQKFKVHTWSLFSMI